MLYNISTGTYHFLTAEGKTLCGCGCKSTNWMPSELPHFYREEQICGACKEKKAQLDRIAEFRRLNG